MALRKAASLWLTADCKAEPMSALRSLEPASDHHRGRADLLKVSFDDCTAVAQ
jgi:hypothetical protein